MDSPSAFEAPDAPTPARGFTPGRLALFVLSIALVVASAGLSIRWLARAPSLPWTGVTWVASDTLAARRTSGIGMGFGIGARPGEIVQLRPGGPGERAGLRARDRVLSIGGVPSAAESVLIARAAGAAPGDTIAFVVARGADTLAVAVPVEAWRHSAGGSLVAGSYAVIALLWWLIGLFVWLRRPADVRGTVFGLLCAAAASTYLLTATLGAQSNGTGLTAAGTFDTALGLSFAVLAVVGPLFSTLLLHFSLVFPRPRPLLRDWPESLHWVYAGGGYPVFGLVVAFLPLLAGREHRVAALATVAVLLVAAVVAFARRRVGAPGLRARLARQPWLAVAIVCLAGAVLSGTGTLFAGPELRPLRTTIVFAGLLPPSLGFIVGPFVLGAITVVALLRSYRESGLEERQQIRWPLYGIVFSLALSLLVTVVIVACGFLLDPQRFSALQPVFGVLNGLATVTIPLGFAVGILRYRVMDLDVVIRRTVIYGASLGLLTLLFVAAVVLAGEVAGRAFGARNSLAAPFATLVVALVAFPAFRRVRDVLDRRFFRTRYDAGAVLRRIGEAVSHHPAGPALARRVAEELQVALRSRSVALLVRGGSALVPATALGVDAARFERLRVPLDDAGLGPLGRQPHLSAGEAAGTLADVARTARAAVLVPARHQGTLHGVIAVGGKLSDEGFTAPDLEFLAAAAGQLAFGLASVETRGQRRELDEAREIQSSLLPARLPEAPGLRLAAHWQPAKQVAGDYYDAFPLDGGRLAVCVADVTGKGMPAALLMSNLQATVKAFAPSMGSPAALCARVNRVLSAQITLGRFITFFYAEFETDGRALRYANAGHNPPLLLRAGGAAEWLDAGGPLLGVVPDAGYEEATTTLAPGDTLVLYTDGITEAQAATGELFGEERLLASVRAAAGGGPEAVQRRLLDDVAAHCAGEWGDDATVLVLRAT